jgi:YVTN family beta-propeller protein
MIRCGLKTLIAYIFAITLVIAHTPLVPAAEFAYVTNERGNTVSVIDIKGDKVVAKVPVGKEPRWLQISADENLVYVTNHSSNTVSKISTDTNQVVATVSVGVGPCWLELANDNLLSVANRDEGSVSLIDTQKDSVVATFEFGSDALTNWGKEKASATLAQRLGRQSIIYLNEGIDNAVLIAVPLDGSAPTIEDTIKTGDGSGPRWLDVLKFDDRSVDYISLGGSDQVLALEYPSNKILATIPVGKGPYWIRITPDARFVYVMNVDGNSVSKISIVDNKVVAEIPVGLSPHYPVITDDSSHVFVPNFEDDTVSVVSVEKDSVVATVKVEKNPTWINISPDGTKAYVTNKGSNTVSVISTSTFKVISTIPVGESPNMIITRPHRHVHVEGVTAVQPRDKRVTIFGLVKRNALLQNYPNPFNPETWIPYRLASEAFVTLTIYDMEEAVVRTLEVGHQSAALYESKDKAIYWDGRNDIGEHVASGIYFYTLTANDFTATRKMLILK